MPLLDLSQNCNITNNTFQQDLFSYSVSGDNIVWSDNSTTPYSVQLINGQSIFDIVATTGHWTPYIIDSDTQVLYKTISHYGSIWNNKDFTTNRLGIDDFITFAPKFRNWTSNGTMTIDWITNRARSPYTVYGGLSCWGKIIPPKTGSIDKFPIYSKLEYNNNTYIKIDSNIVRRITPDRGSSYTFLSNNITFNYDNYGDILLKEPPATNAEGLTIRTIFSLYGSGKKVLWIPDGDQIFYFYNNVEKEANLRKDIGPRSYISASLYQYYTNIYNALTIDAPLISVNQSRSLRKLRLFKKLSHSLATSPFISEFFINALLDPSNTLKTAVNTYLNSTSSSISIDFNNLRTVLDAIAIEFNTYEISSFNNIINNNSELFQKFINKYGAKLKLTGNASVSHQGLKYGDSVLYNEVGDMFVPKELTNTTVINNKIVRVGQLSYETNFSEETATILLKVNNVTKNTIYLNNHIKPNIVNTIDPYYDIRGRLARYGSSLGIVLNTNYIDGISNTPRIIEGATGPVDYSPSSWQGNGSVLYWNYTAPLVENIVDGQRTSTIQKPPIRIYPRLRVLDLAVDLRLSPVDAAIYGRGNNAYNLIANQFICQWEKVEGPELRFVDFNKKPNLNQPLGISPDTDIYGEPIGNSNTTALGFTANGPEVIMIPSNLGKYTIKCTVNSPYGSYVLYRTIFVVDGRPGIFYNRYYEVTDDMMPIYTRQEGDDPILALDHYSIGMNFVYQRDNNTGQEIVPNDIFPLVTQDIINEFSLQNRRIRINQDNLKIHGANLGSYAIHRNGLFTGIDSEYYIETVYQNERPIEKLSNNNFQFLFSESEPIQPRTQDSSFTIDYILNNTVVKLDSIILENIRQDNEECSQCYSLYNPKFRAYITKKNSADTGRTIFERSRKAPDDFGVQKYNYNLQTNSVTTSDIIYYQYPIISTDIAPPIKSYGGYGYKVLNKIGITGIPNHTKPTTTRNNVGIIAESPYVLPSVTGHKLDYEDDYENQMTPGPLGGGKIGYKFCYQKYIDQTNNSIEFTKGVFNPNSGWIMNSNDNLSSVLKFNPGARDSFSFVGPSIDRLSTFTSTDMLKPSIYSSSISIKINPLIVWSPGPEIMGDSNKCCGAPCVPGAKAEYYWGNDIGLDISDQFQATVPDEAGAGYHHGYRILGGGLSKTAETNYKDQQDPSNDEFKLFTDKIKNKHSYYFNTVGYNKKITPPPSFINIFSLDPSQQDPLLRNQAIEELNSPNRWGLRNPKILSLNASDIEVKLNFLNSINTKNLAIWIEMKPSAGSLLPPLTNDNRRPQSQSPIVTTNNFIDQIFDPKTYMGDYLNYADPNFPSSYSIDVSNQDLSRFLIDLTNHNSVSGSYETMKLFLLNQETVQNQQYNFSLTFSDRANASSCLFDINSYSNSKIKPNQEILLNNGRCRPSYSSPGYSTKQNSYYRNLIQYHKLNITNNTLSKFCSKSLFIGVLQSDSCQPIFPIHNSSTEFVLKVAILDEEDEMFPIDTIISSDLYTNLVGSTKLSPNNIFNNLCNWEIIIHGGKTPKPYVQSVNNIDTYGSTDALSLIKYGDHPQYPGYSFIADLSDSLFLLPYINQNAPNTFFQNCDLCNNLSIDPIIRNQPFIERPRFPSEAILAITANRVGALVLGRGGPYQALVDYFNASAAIYNLEFAQRETYDIEYDSYTNGGSDKVLLNVSDDGCFWYKLEASIFKLDNTPALPLQKYQFHKGSGDLFKFDFEIINQKKDLIDESFIDNFIDEQSCQDSTSVECNPNNIPTIDLLNNNEYISYNKVLAFNNIFQYLNNTSYEIISIDNSIAYDLFDRNDIVRLTNCSLENDNSDIPIRVVAKSLIYKDNSYKTILVLYKGSAVIPCGQIRVPNNIIIVYASNNTHYSLNKISPISDMGLHVDRFPKPDQMNTFSTNSIGSYGDGSVVKEKNILSDTISLYSLEPLYELLNNHKHDKLFYNSLFLNGSGIDPSSIKAYPAYYNTSNINSNSIKNSFYYIQQDSVQNIENLLDNNHNTLKDNKTYLKDKSYNILYLKISDTNNFISSLPTGIVGDIQIENSYTYKETIEKLTDTEFSTLTSRLAVINMEKIQSLDNLVGNTRSTASILNSDSIKYIQDHYSAIEDDPANCGNLCYKKQTLNKLRKLYTERSEILKLLEDQGIKKAKIYVRENDGPIEGEILYDDFGSQKIKLNNSQEFDKNSIFKIEYFYIPNPEKNIYTTTSGGILPNQKAIITSNIDGSINIVYNNLTKNKYWINIDPRQSCSIAEELRPKVLKATYYRVDLTNPPSETRRNLNANNNISPDFLYKGGNVFFGDVKVYNGPFSFTYLEKGADLNLAGQANAYAGIPVESNTIELDTSGPIATKKTEIENQFAGKIYGWKEKFVERRFRIHNDKAIDSILDDNEFIIRVLEVYDVAITRLEFFSDLSISDLVSQNIVENDFSADVGGGLLNGLSTDTKNRRPTRVYNIFNMNNLSSLKVQFRKTPRLIRGVDLAGTVLRYGSNTSYRPQSIVPAEAPNDVFSIANLNQPSLINNMYCWHCYQLEPETYRIISAETPPIFQHMNEMWFRSFYGSADNIEVKGKVMKSQYDWETIPFEYFTKRIENSE
jgi:hypothetical protein